MSEWQPILPPERYRQIMSNVRRLMPRKLAKTPNGVLAMDLFGNGSGYSVQTCRYAEIDPEGFTIPFVWAPKPPAAADLAISLAS
jgi:hypothetical protein